jgi:hypothetical protein
VVAAQTDTLQPGLYEAESDTLQPYYAGAGWVQVVDGDYSVMETAVEGDSVSFTVSGSQLVLYRELLAVDGGTAEICVNALCATFSSISSTDQKGVPIAFPVEADATVTVTHISGTLRLDSFLLFGLPDELEPVPPPDPAAEYVALADGSLAVIYRSISGGEILQIALSGAVLTALLVLIVVTAWKR